MEIRYTKVYKNGEVIREEPYEVGDTELAEEKEVSDILSHADALIDKDPKVFLKRLTKRLISRGMI